nr:ankyrin repeat domain-containing protein SOWAHD [Vulpes vulpes]
MENIHIPHNAADSCPLPPIPKRIVRILFKMTSRPPHHRPCCYCLLLRIYLRAEGIPGNPALCGEGQGQTKGKAGEPESRAASANRGAGRRRLGDKGGLTPLHLAALQGHDMVIKVLVGALGADPTRRDYSGHRACHYLRPNAPQSLRELSGAEEWETAGRSERNNANNNSSGAAPWTPRRSPSSVGTNSAETQARAAAATGKEKNYTGSRVAQIQGLLRQVFPFFQDR